MGKGAYRNIRQIKKQLQNVILNKYIRLTLGEMLEWIEKWNLSAWNFLQFITKTAFLFLVFQDL